MSTQPEGPNLCRSCGAQTVSALSALCAACFSTAAARQQVRPRPRHEGVGPEPGELPTLGELGELLARGTRDSIVGLVWRSVLGVLAVIVVLVFLIVNGGVGGASPLEVIVMAAILTFALLPIARGLR